MNRAVELSSLCGMDVVQSAVCFFTNGCDVIVEHVLGWIDIELFYLTGQCLRKTDGPRSPIGTEVMVVYAPSSHLRVKK